MRTKTVRTIRVLILATAIGWMSAPQALATDFWATYSSTFMSNYTAKTGMAMEHGMSERLTEREVLGMATKSFSQSFGARFSEVARDNRGLLIVCIFSREPERCYMDSVLKTTFDEIHFVPAPGFSQKFIKKFARVYSASLMKPRSIHGREERAAGVPRKKNFNPRFGFSLDGFELVAAAPFYTYKGIYVEPLWGTSNGVGLSLTKGRIGLMFDHDSAAVQYHIPKSSLTQLVLTIRTTGDLFIDNIFLRW